MNNKVKGAFLTIFGGICWGLSGSVGQYLFRHENMDSRWLVPIRLGLAGVILLIYSLIRFHGKTFGVWTDRRSARDMIIYGLAGVSLCQFFYFTTIQLSTAGTATVLQCVAPVPILLVTCIRSHRGPTGKEIAAIVLAIAGVYLITTHADPGNMPVSWLAIITGLAAAVCIMIYNVSPGKLLEEYSVITIQGWAFFMGGIFFALVFHIWTWDYSPSLTGILGIAFVVLVGNILAFTSYIRGIQLIGPVKGILYGFSEPVTAALVSTLLLGSEFTWWDAAGFAMIFFMLVMISLSQQKEQRSDI